MENIVIYTCLYLLLSFSKFELIVEDMESCHGRETLEELNYLVCVFVQYLIYYCIMIICVTLNSRHMI